MDDLLSAKVEPKPTRSVGVWSLAIMTYFVVSGGPFGMELCVKAAGPLITLSAYALMPIVWAIPQSLACAELSCMMDENGGAILWVHRAFGDFWSWMNAWNRVFANTIDAALYPTLVACYISAHTETNYSYEIKLFVVISCMIFNILGVQAVGVVSTAIAASVMLPFLMEIPYRASSIAVSQWTAVPENIDWALFLGTLNWAFSGYDDMGSVAGEVKDPSRTYIRAMMLALLLTCFTYILPTVLGLTFSDVPLEEWDEGYYQVVGNRISPWVGQLLLFSAVCSNYGQYNGNMATDCRVVWALAGGSGDIPVKILPKALAYISPTYGTPVLAIIVQSFVISLFMLTDFSVLVQADAFFTCICIFLQFASFLCLRYTEPFAPRPYVVPGGMFGAWLITIPKFLIVVVTLIFSDTSVIWAAFFANLLFILAYVPFCWLRSARQQGETQPLVP